LQIKVWPVVKNWLSTFINQPTPPKGNKATKGNSATEYSIYTKIIWDVVYYLQYGACCEWTL